MNPKQYGVERRDFLKYLSALSTVPLLGQQVEGRVLQQPKFKENPFSLGVASGDPSPTGFVLWTRLAPDPLHDGGMPADFVNVRWQVAEDEQMTKVVKKGTAIATPQLGHSVHVEVEGLEPDRWYFFQFKAGTEISPVGPDLERHQNSARCPIKCDLHTRPASISSTAISTVTTI